MFRSDLNRSLRDYCVIEATWLVTGSFYKQLNATHAVLREFCGIAFSDNRVTNQVFARS